MGLLKFKEQKNKICTRCKEVLKKQELGTNIVYYCRSCGSLVSADFI